MPSAPPVVLTIAGFDPSSGAGVSADIKTIAAHGCYGIACITALTVQSTTGVRRVEAVSARLVRETLDEVAADMKPAAVRIGMLVSAPIVDAVADFLEARKPPNVVLDPVMRSSSGSELLDAKGIERLSRRLLPRVAVVTPNIDEAATLTSRPVTDLTGMKAAARELHRMGARVVVVTGGHLERAVDLLSVAGEGEPEQSEFASERLATTSTHGTGCAFATALASNLALGRQVKDAVVLAKAYVTQAIARSFPIGHGSGPIHHLFRMEQAPRPVPDLPEPSH
ncbi:MAG TPA: bifunctional hydroxymethylpyrimidine kinase/phosphomethylpyrimidine kinase [Terriglobales bacterium]|nr:bifunctional hydroxymethylpyrimidine kinase/phosphomethylpyrimidine kinase [Terriglobales bacterium]